MAPLQLCRALTHQLSKRRVELAQVPIANQHDGRGVVEDGGLLLQQFVEHALAALQLCLGAHALRHFLLQTHDGNALATLIKNGRQGDFVVVDASIAPLVDEGAAPRLARQQGCPHGLVHCRRRLPARHDRRFAPLDLLQRVAAVALVLRVHPLDKAFTVCDDDSHRAAFQGAVPSTLKRSNARVTCALLRSRSSSSHPSMENNIKAAKPTCRRCDQGISPLTSSSIKSCHCPPGSLQSTARREMAWGTPFRTTCDASRLKGSSEARPLSK